MARLWTLVNSSASPQPGPPVRRTCARHAAGPVSAGFKATEPVYVLAYAVGSPAHLERAPLSLCAADLIRASGCSLLSDGDEYE